MTALLLALVSVVAAQVATDEAQEPIPIVDGVPSEAEVLAKLQPAPTQARSFRATWEERPGPERPARVAWRVTAKAGYRIQIERFDMSGPDRIRERYALAPSTNVRSLSEAPVWIRWLMGEKRPGLVKMLNLDESFRALDVVERRVLWVLGAQANDPNNPQIRIDRETGELRRIVERRSENGASALLDVALFDRVEADPIPWLPHRLHVRVGDTYAVLHLTSSALLKHSPPAARQDVEP